MESFPNSESPLAAFLEGKGTGHVQLAENDSATESSTPTQPTQTSLRSRIRKYLTSRQSAWSPKYPTTSHSFRENHFLEQFRYIIVGSHLLDESQDITPGKDITASASVSVPDPVFPESVFDWIGALVIAIAAFILAFTVKFVRDRSSFLDQLLVIASCAVLLAPLYMTSRTLLHRHHVRNQVIKSASNLIAILHDFERASAAAISFIQEIELVAKGYRISSPLPPITRLDDNRASRRCEFLRRQLSRCLLDQIQLLRRAIESLRPYIHSEVLEKYLEIYDLPHGWADAFQLLASSSENEPESGELGTLGDLRLTNYKRSLCRRHFLCALLAIDSDGDSLDLARWQMITCETDRLSLAISAQVHVLNSTLTELSDSITLSNTKPSGSEVSGRIRDQLRQIATLSQGVRSLNAKMALIREESGRAVADREDLTDLGPLLMEQYESIGVELQSLLQDWETGKAALTSDTIRHERCSSLMSSTSAILSPTLSLGGMTAVSDREASRYDTSLLSSSRGGSPADALRALNGGDASSDTSSGAEHEQIFEAIALPRKRTSILFPPGTSRAEKLARANEDRAQRQAAAREKRVSGSNMIRELQSVINLRRTSMPAPVTRGLGSTTSTSTAATASAAPAAAPVAVQSDNYNNQNSTDASPSGSPHPRHQKRLRMTTEQIPGPDEPSLDESIPSDGRHSFFSETKHDSFSAEEHKMSLAAALAVVRNRQTNTTIDE